MQSEEYRNGMSVSVSVRREVLGDDYVDKAIDAATDFTHLLQDLVTENCWVNERGHVKVFLWL